MTHSDSPARPAAHWIHLVLLIALVAILQAGVLVIGTENLFTLSVFTRSLYTWFPSIAGIAISIVGPSRRVTRNALLVGPAVVVLMIGLDFFGGSRPESAGQVLALFPNASSSPLAQASELASISWMETLLDWARGNLGEIDQLQVTYGFADPRLRVAHAATEGGLLFVVYACMGFVIAAMSWVRAHVVFKKAQDATAFYIVLSWLVAPLVFTLSRQFAGHQRFRVLFRGASPWQALIPSLIAFALGSFLWWYTARYREPEDA
jgi:hypothetical protein